MPRTPHQFKEIREVRKQQIMTVALELFAQKGYHATSIASIAKEAEISKGLLYNYFPSKEELVVEIMKEGFNQIFDFFKPSNGESFTKQEMKNLICDIFTSFKDRSQFWRLYFAVMSQPIVSEAAFGDIMKIAMPIFQMLSEYFERMGFANPEAESRFFSAMLDGITLNYVYDPDNFPAEQVKARILNMYNLND